jgi:hypothetical protein
MDPLSLLWLFFVLASLQPSVQRQMLLLARRRALAAISRETTISSHATRRPARTRR